MESEKKPSVRIERIEFRPPLAIGRLGGASTPLENYVWREDPTIHSSARTVIDPALSFEVLEDGSLEPFTPAVIRFREDGKLRPVAPFFELWAEVTEGDAAHSEFKPLTKKILEDAGGKLSALVYDVAVANRKAARRSGSDANAFAAVIQARGDDHLRRRLFAFSVAPPGGHPLVLASRPIPLGWFQVIRPVPQEVNAVDLGVLRVRFTPAEGQVYGPPTAVNAADPVTERTYDIVPEANRILNPDATWLHYSLTDETSGYFHPDPADTYDGAGQHPGASEVFDGEDRGSEQSWGVVDDTCDGLLTANLVIEGNHLKATARICVGPPDYAPDRRPFLSLADDLADRDKDRMGQLTEDQVEAVQHRLADLFQRVWETASLTNLDAIRARALADNANKPAATPGTKPPATGRHASGDFVLTKHGLPGTGSDDVLAVDDKSMRPGDKLADDKVDWVFAPGHQVQGNLVFQELIAMAHRSLADEVTLIEFVNKDPVRVRQMMRPAYGDFEQLPNSVPAGAEPNSGYRDPRVTRDLLHDMRMPPYMRDELARALSLTRRQYAELIAYLDYLDSQKREAPPQPGTPPPFEMPSYPTYHGPSPTGLQGAGSQSGGLQSSEVYSPPPTYIIAPDDATPEPAASPISTPLSRQIDATLAMMEEDSP